MAFKDSAKIPNAISRSGKFISVTEYRVYCTIVGLGRGWVPPSSIQSECALSTPRIVKALRGLEVLGLIETSEKKTSSASGEVKVRVTHQNRWKFSKAHRAHLQDVL